MEVNRPGKDTIVYYFDVFYKNKAERYVFCPTDYIGVGIINDHISYLVSSHTTSDPIPNQLFVSREASFCKYLREYKEEIDEWLKRKLLKERFWGNSCDSQNVDAMISRKGMGGTYMLPKDNIEQHKNI